MRRVEIKNAAERIVSAIKQTKLVPAVLGVVPASERTKGENISRAIHSLHQFGLLAANFGTAETEMMERLKLSSLLESETWAKLLTESDSNAARRLVNDVRNAVDFLPKFVDLIEPDYQQEILQKSPDVPKVLEGKTLLTVIAIEDRQQFSGPQRLIEVMQSIMLLYEALAILSEQSADDLIVLSCDSGSDKSFDFLGAAKLMEELRELILSLWDKVVFFREKKAAERIDLVAKSLPVIEEIARLREAGALAPEKAEIVSRKVMEGVEKFLKNGATIPEIRNRSQFDSRALLAPQIKLLTDSVEAGARTTTEVAGGGDQQTLSDTLSPEEQFELQRLVAKLQNSGELTGEAEGGDGNETSSFERRDSDED